MPVYDYECRECGIFTALRPMSDCRSLLACPNCGVDAVRTFQTAPAIAGIDSVKRAAIAINERSANAPRMSDRHHGASCTCCAGKRWGGVPKPADALKSFPKTRPWM